MRDLRYPHRKNLVNKASFFSKDTEWNGVHGREAVYRVDDMKEPLRVFNGSGWITVSDVGYIWYQMALRDQFVWMHASFNPKGELVEVYFDITGGNRFDDSENPCFEDMYLDVVVTPAGELRLLDRDELDQALAEGKLTYEAYEAAIAHCDALWRDLEQNRFRVLDYCRAHQRELMRYGLTPII